MAIYSITFATDLVDTKNAASRLVLSKKYRRRRRVSCRDIFLSEIFVDVDRLIKYILLLLLLAGGAVNDGNHQRSRSSVLYRRSSLRLPTGRRAVPVAVVGSQLLTPGGLIRRRSTVRARWRGVAVTVGRTRKPTASPRSASRKVISSNR